MTPCVPPPGLIEVALKEFVEGWLPEHQLVCRHQHPSIKHQHNISWTFGVIFYETCTVS